MQANTDLEDVEWKDLSKVSDTILGNSAAFSRSLKK